MIVDDNYLELLTSTSFLRDEEVLYHLKCNEDILIRPILVTDCERFVNCVESTLTLDKNYSGGVEVIKMSYLEYICCIIAQDEYRLRLFKTLMKLSLGASDICIEEPNGKIVLGLKYEGSEDIKYITSKEFEDIKKIILYQNIIDYDDTEVHPDIKKIMEDYYRLSSDGNSRKVTMEEKVCMVANNGALRKKDVLEMTFREFSIRFNLIIDEIEYKINKTAELSGNVKFKDKIEHFIFKKKRNKFDNLFLNADAVKDKIEGANNK